MMKVYRYMCESQVQCYQILTGIELGRKKIVPTQEIKLHISQETVERNKFVYLQGKEEGK